MTTLKCKSCRIGANQLSPKQPTARRHDRRWCVALELSICPALNGISETLETGVVQRKFLMMTLINLGYGGFCGVQRSILLS